MLPYTRYLSGPNRTCAIESKFKAMPWEERALYGCEDATPILHLLLDTLNAPTDAHLPSITPSGGIGRHKKA
jgi:hypothetical protein